MDLVYILTLIILICGCFYFILYNIAHAIGTTNSSGSLVQLHNRLPFSSLVLASWDYSINSVEVSWEGAADPSWRKLWVVKGAG